MKLSKIKIIFLLTYQSILISESLQEVYNNAEPGFGYDKYIILNENTIYTGGLGIYEGDVYINCSGSTIDLQEGQGIWIYADEEYPASLDIEHCSIANGLYYGLSYGGISNGNIINCNFIETNFGLKLFDSSNVFITNSIFINQYSTGIAIYTEIPILDASYLLFWENESDCMENCPG